MTAPDLKVARKLARLALTARLVACTNLMPKIESHYWWEGRIQSSSEVLLVLKTTRPKLVALEKLILQEHPYDTPEFVTVSLQSGNGRYLDWITNSVGKG